MKRINISRMLSPVIPALMMLIITGCGHDSVKVYHVETNETVTPPVPPAPVQATTPSSEMPMTMPAGLPTPDHSGLAPLKYTLPAGWKEKELTQMRVASFSADENGKQADVSVIPMGGMAGGDAANVNRWLGQVGQPRVTEDEVTKMAEKVAVGDQTAELYDMAGTAPGSSDAQRILAVALHRDDMVWFFKMTGDAALVEAQKPAFLSFLKSVEFGGPMASSTTAAPDMSQLPPSHPPIGGMSPAATAEPAGNKPVWDVPAGWQEGPLTQFLVAKYVITGAGDAKAEVNVSPLDRDRADLTSNVNRWRGQLGLAPTTSDEVAKLATIDASGARGSVVELSGTDMRSNKQASLVGVMLPLGSQTWFYKLMGDPEIVAQQKDVLIKFVQSAKYPDVH